MRLESRTWFLLSLILFAAAAYFWKRGNEYQREKEKSVPPVQEHSPSPAALQRTGSNPFPLLSQLPANQSGTGAGGVRTLGSTPIPAALLPAESPAADTNFPHRLANTSRTIEQLTRVETALLMRNALIDTAREAKLPIPEHLRAQGDPGSYIVQSRGAIQPAFRERLREAGAAVVAYIPNNAYLVEMSAEAADGLARMPELQAVLPYEPYYKLETKLLALAVDQKPLTPEDWLRITVFPGARAAALDAVASLGGEVVAEERTPFGPQLLVKPALESLPQIAGLAPVQTVELYYPRELLTDQSRVVVGVAPNGSSLTNYMDLTGSNVLINLNEPGVDAEHPDLAGRILGDTSDVLRDPFAHGTHIAGIIAGSGAESSSVSGPVAGSETNANFRGIAPEAQLFVLPLYPVPDVSPLLNEVYLQETAARTNAVSQRPNGPMISNNSWGYSGFNEYDSSSARFDAAVRDALPDTTGSQPMIFVFAAGNSGDGEDQGLGGFANSIPSPANAKNVITVGATEFLRLITNAVLSTNIDGSITTNAVFLGMTDSSEEVAAFSSRGNVGIGSEGQFGRFKPDVVAPGAFIVATRADTWRLENQVETNTPQFEILEELNEPLAPYYRFDSGTSQSAPVVSGMLALMQEFFEQRLPTGLRRTNSPALMKALLINGARSLGFLYDFQVQNAMNLQGWGLVNLTNSIPPPLLTEPEARWPVQMFDQSPTNALATGESQSWNLTLSTNVQDLPLRVTLVWTDPPGNPNAAIKLVNDLDLVVSNTVSGVVYYGNDIREQSDFNFATFPDVIPVTDVVNNVENVYIRQPEGTNFVVSVVARRVNVSALPDYHQVTGRINDVVQDFALVISTGDVTATNALTVRPVTAPLPPAPAEPISMTNGVPLLNQRVGANSSLSPSPHGISNQWQFFVFTNLFFTNDISSMTNGTNVGFVTFLPPNVSRARNVSADVDLYVSRDSRLLQLEPAVVEAAWQSATRGGTESIVFTNAVLGDVFYIGVKAEDQQGAEYGLIALSSDVPFEEDRDGVKILNGMPVPQDIPDGTATDPGRSTIMAIGISPITVQRVVVTNVLTHEDVGDLIVLLDHEQTSVVLHNHTLNFDTPGGTNMFFIYDDRPFGDTFGTRRSDGPGSLNDFSGMQGNGVWMMNFIDNAPSQTGRVELVTLRLEPFVNGDLGAAGSAGISGRVAPNDAACFFLDVPPEATNMIVNVSQISGPLEVLISHGSIPSTNQLDKSALIEPPGGTVMLGADDQPFPLQVGRYFICLFNPSPNDSVDFHVAVLLELGVGLDVQRTLTITNAIPLVDDGVISSVLDVPVDKAVADVQVAVRIDHPRSSDLVLHLISPQGTRVLLAENRGGPESRGYGGGSGSNITYTIFTEDTNLLETLAPIKFSLPPWVAPNTSTNPAAFEDDFEIALPGLYTNNQTVSGWTVSQGSVLVHGPDNALGGVAQSGTNFVELAAGPNGASGLVTSFSTVPGREYSLNFYHQLNRAAPPENPQQVQVYLGPPNNFRAPSNIIDVLNPGWTPANILFTAAAGQTELELSTTNAWGPWLDNVSVRETIPSTNIYVLPEETLTLLQGQRALGDWTLEVWDNRRGPLGAGTGTLINWELQLKYGSPRGLATMLTNGIVYSGVLTNSQTNYFYIDVCESVQVAFVTLAGPFAQLTLLADRDGFPTGDQFLDDYAQLPNILPAGESGELGFATLHLTADPHYPAPLQPGRRLFFGVHNIDLEATNTFDLQVVFDNDTCSGPPPVIRLENDVAYTNVVAPSALLLDYYVFNVSPFAVEAEFEARPLDDNGDIGMVLSYGLPLPDLTTFDYRSDRTGFTNELIVLTDASEPVPLLPGDWYIGIYNNSTNAVVYDVRASEVLDTNVNVILLTNAIPVVFTLEQDAALTNYFLFRVLDPYPGVTFDLFDLTGTADLFIGYNSVPSPTAYWYSNSASPTQPITVEIRTNANLPEVTGNWVLQVVNTGLSNLTFTIRASYLQLTNVPPPSTNRVFDPDITVTSTNICFSWPSTVGVQYRLEGKTNITDAAWEVLFGPVAATEGLMRFCLNLPTGFSYFQVVEIGTTQPPSRIIDPGLTITTNSICLNWPSTIGSVYQVQAKVEITDPAWTNLATAITATSTNSSYCISRPTPYQYFQIVENPGGSPEPPPGTGTVIDPDLSVSTNELCLAWPSQTGVVYVVQAKVEITDLAWTNVSQAITATSTTTSYCIPRPTPYQFFQVLAGTNTPPPPPVTGTVIDPDLSVSTNELCLAWPSQPGIVYVLQGKVQITDPSWTNVSQAITATSTNTSYCIPRPTSYQFFQVIAGTDTPPPVTGTVIDPDLSVSTNELCLAWPSQTGIVYVVQGKVEITDLAWTNVSQTITAISTNTSYCIPRPTPYQFFQVIAGTNTPPPPVTGTVIDPNLRVSTNELCLSWSSQTGLVYVVQGKVQITDLAWTNVSETITATATNSSYCIPRPTPYQFFQVIEGTATPEPPPVTGTVVDPNLRVSTNELCLSWSSQTGLVYVVQGKVQITDLAWTNVSETITATATNSSHCIPRPTPYQYFQVMAGTVTPEPPGGGATNVANLRAPAVLADGRLQLVWDAQPGASYEVQVATNLLPVINWMTLTNITVTSTNVAITDPTSVSDGIMRFYRIRER